MEPAGREGERNNPAKQVYIEIASATPRNDIL